MADFQNNLETFSKCEYLGHRHPELELLVGDWESVFLVNSPGSSYPVILALGCRMAFGTQYSKKVGKMLIGTVFPFCFGGRVEERGRVQYNYVFF